MLDMSPAPMTRARNERRIGDGRTGCVTTSRRSLSSGMLTTVRHDGADRRP
jgi:hypothetical protein